MREDARRQTAGDGANTTEDKDCNVGTYRHRGKHRRAVNGIQGLDTAKEARKRHERGIMIAM